MRPTLLSLIVLHGLAIHVFAQSSGFLPINTGGSINSQFEESNPILSPDGGTLYFTRINHPGNRFGVKGSQDIWYSLKQEDGSWSLAERMPDQVNIGRFNALAGISEDGNTLYVHGIFTNSGKNWKKRGFSTITRSENGWMKPVPVKLPGYTAIHEGNYSSAHFDLHQKVVFICFSKKVRSDRSNIYVSHMDANQAWTRLEKIDALSTRYDEITPFYDAKNETLYFSSNRKSKSNYDVYWSKKIMANAWDYWEKPVELGESVNSPEWEAYYKINRQGNMAYFASNQNSYGNADIFTIKLYEDKPYVELVSKVEYKGDSNPVDDLVMTINHEVVDSIAIDPFSNSFNIKLPFGSDYRITANSFYYVGDTISIAASNKKEHETVYARLVVHEKPYTVIRGKILDKWTREPVQVSESSKVVFQSLKNDTVRISSQGDYHYKLVSMQDYIVHVLVEGYAPITEKISITDSPATKYMNKDYYLDNEQVAFLSGRILDKNRLETIKTGSTVKIYSDSAEIFTGIVSDSSFQYTLLLPLKKKHTLRAVSDNYISIEENIDLTGESSRLKIMKDLFLAPIEVGTTIVLNNILFETGSAKLKPESFKELIKVSRFLHENSKVSIEISGHTDSTGSKTANLNLSKARANSVVQFLYDTDIQKERIESKGFGDTMPVAENTTAEGRSANRRVEFKIIGVEN